MDLDRIVEEVRQSEEWEAVKMDILEIGIEQGIKALIETCQELGVLREDTAVRLIEKFSLQKEAAEEYLEKYWQKSI